MKILRKSLGAMKKTTPIRLVSATPMRRLYQDIDLTMGNCRAPVNIPTSVSSDTEIPTISMPGRLSSRVASPKAATCSVPKWDMNRFRNIT